MGPINNNHIPFVAYHEAGHAVAAIVQGTGLLGVDIIPQVTPMGDVGLAGADLVRPNDQDILGAGEAAVLPFLITVAAGWVAEKLFNPDAMLEALHPNSDGEIIRRYATGALCNPEFRNRQIIIPEAEQIANKERIEALLNRVEQEAETFVAMYQDTISTVAQVLAQKGNLSPEEVYTLVERNPPTNAT